MDALLFAFVAAALAGIGDQTQVLAGSLSARGDRPGAILAGMAIAAAGMAAIAFIAASFVSDMVGVRAQTQFVALALAFAGITGLMKPEPLRWAERVRWGGFLGALLFGGYAAASGRIQFMSLAFAIRAEMPVFAAVGGALGLLAAAIPAALLGDKFLALNLRPARIAIGVVLLVAGALVFLNAPPPAV
ncbi:TMEM165/GDT1 family protein [Sphingosinicella sp. YJ22]|uniref:TMEM165/GDT1 family protein n=1 Tax=Sphingosinicella sp. YJ22 TaxID=1104780 RepID=UPI00140A8C26|nr:TMEM165/GDT1 family protein [Sphingosinicella sp. YJ22]